MTKQLQLNRKVTISNLTILDDKLTIFYDSPQMVAQVMEPWFGQMISEIDYRLKTTSGGIKSIDNVNSFKVFSQIIKPPDLLTMLNREADLFQVRFDQPKVEFYFEIRPSRPDKLTSIFDVKLTITLLSDSENESNP